MVTSVGLRVRVRVRHRVRLSVKDRVRVKVSADLDGDERFVSVLPRVLGQLLIQNRGLRVVGPSVCVCVCVCVSVSVGARRANEMGRCVKRTPALP